MRPLWLVVAARGGRGRAALVAACTAVTTALLLVAVSVVRLGRADAYAGAGRERLLAPIADPGTRAGAVVAILLTTVPLLLLLDQAVRLGSASRHRRFVALAVAGATGRDLRRWSAIEVSAPAAAGALLGVPVWLLLRQLLGVGLAAHTGALVPVSVGPGAWAVAVLLVVVAYAGWVGRRAGSRAAEAVAGGRGPRRAPRPWVALALLGLAVLVGWGYLGDVGGLRDLVGPVTVLLLALGTAALSPWLAYVAARWMARRARSAAMLLAARRLMTDPRPAARAAAAVGAVAMTAGVLSAFVPALSSGNYAAGDYLVPALVVGVLALVALLTIAGSLGVHSTETVLERRREMAALVATGIPARVVSDSQRLEGLVATLPLALIGVLVGGYGYGLLDNVGARGLLMVTVAVPLTLAVVYAAVAGATRLLRPWLLDAVDGASLRTE